MKRTAMRAALAAALLQSLVGPAGAEPGRVEIPIRQTVLGDGTIRYSVPVSIGGGAPIDTMLDTGSFGLRVLSSALSPAVYQSTGVDRRYRYGSGAVLRGPIATARVALGEAATAEPIGVQVIESVGCAPRQPNCPASRIPASQYGIGGDGLAGQGFKAIMGVSLRRAPGEPGANNPLAALAGSWIVTLPRPGETMPGQLVLNPTSQEAAGFTILRLEAQTGETGGQPGWLDARLPGCLSEGEARPVCAPTMIDSGAPGVVLQSEDVAARRAGSGVPARLSFTQGDATVTATFTTGTDPATELRTTPPGPSGPRIMAGSVPFYALSVLYDPQRGVVGLKSRSE